jgi:hypothetical protein
VEEATKVSEMTVRRTLGEQKKHEVLGTSFISHGKTHKLPKCVTDIGDFNKFVMNFMCKIKHRQLSKLFPKLRDRINFNDGSTSLRNIVKELGFQWKKTRNNRVVLIEKHDVRCMQVSCLTDLNKYREEGHPRMRRTYTVAILDRRTGVMIVHQVCLHQS